MSAFAASMPTLGEQVDLLRGVTYPKSEARTSPAPGYVPILRANNIGADLMFDDLVFVPAKYVKPEQMLQPGDIVVAASSGSRNVVGKAAPLKAPWDGSFGAFCFAVRPRSTVNPNYIAYFMRSGEYRSRVARLAAGVNINNLRREHILNLAFLLPAPSVQANAVARLDEHWSRLDAAQRSLHRARRNLALFREAILTAALCGAMTASDSAARATGTELLESIGEWRLRRWHDSRGRKPYPAPKSPTEVPFRLPESWGIASLEEITDPERTITYGILMPKEDVATGVPYVRVKDIRNDGIDLAGLRRTSAEIAAAYRRSSLRSGDILVAIRGTFGRVAEVPRELEGGNITQDTARVDVSPLLDRRYVAAYLRGPMAQRYFRRVARGVAVKGVNISDLRALPVPVPPVTEQSRIVAEIENRVAVLDELAIEVGLAHSRSSALRSRVLHDALSESWK